MVVTQNTLDDRAFNLYVHPLQKPRFYLALAFALVLVPFVVVALFFGFIVVLPILAFILWVASEVFFAYVLANAILVSPLNYPRINTIAEEMKTKLGFPHQVYIFVYEQGNFNAYLAQRFFRRAIFLNSEILETGVSDDEVRWVVGRFIGYLRARRQAGAAGWLIRAAQRLLVFNFFILPYERALVYTGDRLAVAAIDGDIVSAISAMQKMLVGRQLGYSVNPEGIVQQQRQVKGNVFAFLSRLMSSFPSTTTRYVDLIVFAKGFFPGQYARFAAANPGLPNDMPSLAASPLSGVLPGSYVPSLPSSSP